MFTFFQRVSDGVIVCCAFASKYSTQKVVQHIFMFLPLVPASVAPTIFLLYFTSSNCFISLHFLKCKKVVGLNLLTKGVILIV